MNFDYIVGTSLLLLRICSRSAAILAVVAGLYVCSDLKGEYMVN